MARFDPQPVPGYDPVLRVNLRDKPEGGATLGAVRALWKGDQQLPQRELLVLVHGYNNHRQEAEVAYVGLRTRQGALLSGGKWTQPLDDRMGDTFWPGDANWPGFLDKLDFLFYSAAVSVARDDVARKIANYLRARADVLTVHFLAHSLGCRVALEVMQDIATEGGPKVGKVCLMAAAVPTFKLCPGGALTGAIAAAGQLRVLYSPADMVLSAAFPPGQTIAKGDEGFFPAAVGHAGDVPLMSGKVERQHIPGAAHGDYWGHGSGAPTERSARAIAEFFRFDGGIGKRGLDHRPLPPARRQAGSRAIGAP